MLQKKKFPQIVCGLIVLILPHYILPVETGDYHYLKLYPRNNRGNQHVSERAKDGEALVTDSYYYRQLFCGAAGQLCNSKTKHRYFPEFVLALLSQSFTKEEVSYYCSFSMVTRLNQIKLQQECFKTLKFNRKRRSAQMKVCQEHAAKAQY